MVNSVKQLLEIHQSATGDGTFIHICGPVASPCRKDREREKGYEYS